MNNNISFLNILLNKIIRRIEKGGDIFSWMITYIDTKTLNLLRKLDRHWIFISTYRKNCTYVIFVYLLFIFKIQYIRNSKSSFRSISPIIKLWFYDPMHMTVNNFDLWTIYFINLSTFDHLLVFLCILYSFVMYFRDQEINMKKFYCIYLIKSDFNMLRPIITLYWCL